MHLDAAGAREYAAFDGLRGISRRAFSGLTPLVVTIVVSLLLVRALGITVTNAITGYDNGSPLTEFLLGARTCLIQGAPMLLLVVATANLGPQSGSRRVAALALAVVLSSGLGLLLRLALLQKDWVAAISMASWTWPRYAVLGGMLTFVAEFYRIEVMSAKSAQQAELDHAKFETEMSSARLQILQAQIEPHFLFNTLANVRRLYAENPALGRTMLENLMRYLETALPYMRGRQSTVERDSQLVEAYLNIQRIRMGPRLAFKLDIPADLAGHAIPSMMLLTLVENSIKHGLNPSPNGGLIHLTVRAKGDRLKLTVADTGVGFGSSSGPGVGLANISSRLASEFGTAAGLELQNNEFGGATATIVLPIFETERRG